MTSPNLDALIGAALAAELVGRAGGLLELSKLSDSALRKLGMDVFQSTTGSSHAKQLHAGILMKAPIFVEAFGGEDDFDTAVLKTAQKGIAQLGRKCALVAKADLSGASPDGALGDGEQEKLRAAFARLRMEGKVSVEDTQALSVPFAYVRGEAAKHKRGGVKERKKREAQQEPVSVVARATQRVRMGISEEAQVQHLLQREDIRTEYAKEREVQLMKESRKRGREVVHDEYDDLQSIAL